MQYLGDLEEVRGRTLLDEGICIDLPIIVQQHLICVPGIYLMSYYKQNAEHTSIAKVACTLIFPLPHRKVTFIQKNDKKE
jgi:hypothetical protein